MRVLLVEDSPELAEMLLERFRADGHAMDCERRGDEALETLRFAQFDLVILDVNLPGADGYTVLKKMRQRGDATPVLLLTARSQVDDRVLGLDAGADDYMVKPFDYRELAARCRALARRRAGEASNVLSFGPLTFDRAARRAFLKDVDLDLRNREVQLLEIFIASLGRILSKDDLSDRLYGFEDAPSANALEQSITRLRRKLEASPLTIRTIRGLGYIATVVDD